MRSREGLSRFYSRKVRRVQWSKRVCFSSQGNVVEQISESVFPLLSFFFLDGLWVGGVLWWRVSCRHVQASKLNMLSKCSRSAIQVFFLIFNTCTMPLALWFFFPFSLSNTSTQYQRVLRQYCDIVFFWFWNFVSLVLGDWLGLHLVLGKWI
jgi:hypothetical protein